MWRSVQGKDVKRGRDTCAKAPSNLKKLQKITLTLASASQPQTWTYRQHPPHLLKLSHQKKEHRQYSNISILQSSLRSIFPSLMVLKGALQTKQHLAVPIPRPSFRPYSNHLLDSEKKCSAKLTEQALLDGIQHKLPPIKQDKSRCVMKVLAKGALCQS